MVLLIGLEHDTVPPRVSQDLDLIVDVRLPTDLLARTVDALQDMGFEPAGTGADNVSHRFIRNGIPVDVLAPEGLGPRTSLRTVGTARTISVAGGTFALARTRELSVRHAGRTAAVPIPDLSGAIVVKAAAVRTDHIGGSERHLGDLAFVVSLLDDPVAIKSQLGASQLKRLRSVGELMERTHPAWNTLDPAAADRGHAAWQFLVSKP